MVKKENDVRQGVVPFISVSCRSDIKCIANEAGCLEALVMAFEVLPYAELAVLYEFLVHKSTLLEELVQFTLGNLFKHLFRFAFAACLFPGDVKLLGKNLLRNVILIH